MTSRRKRRQQDGFMKKVSSLFNLDTVSRNSKVHKEFFLKIRFCPTAREGFSLRCVLNLVVHPVPIIHAGGPRYSSHRLGGQKYWFSFPSFQIGNSAHPATRSVIAFHSSPRVNGDRSMKVTT